MNNYSVRHLPALLAILLACSLSGALHAAELKAAFLYPLSNFYGMRPFDGARLCLDQNRQEIYTLARDTVTVFNNSGMEIFRFDQDPAIGTFLDIAFTSDNRMIVLATKDQKVRLVICNFRGEPKSELVLTGLPPEFASFAPNRILARGGKLYLASYNGMRVAVTDEQGAFISGRDLVKDLELTEQQRTDTGISGFDVDREGTMYFSMPSLASIYVLSADGKSKGFGKRGSTAGRFGVNSGVAVDNDGNILVTDKLRTTVIVFDKKFTFVTEFGRRGLGPGDLVVPDDILVDGSNRVYISNLRKRGVVVYQLSNP